MAVRMLAVLALVSVGVAAWRVTAGSGGSAARPLFAPAVLGGQPPGAVVLAREDGDLAVALAVAPRDGRTLLVATVLGPDGGGAAGLGVRISGRSAIPGPDGTYAALLPAARPEPVVRVLVTRNSGTDAVSFRLPAAWPPRPAGAVLERVDRAYAGLASLVIHERLAASPTAAITSVYREAAPSSLAISSSNGDREVVIAGRRWDRHPGAGWVESQQSPALRSVTPFWRGVLQDVTLLGTARVDGRPALRVSFAAPQIPAFFDLVVDRATDRPLRLSMIGAAHFMTHRYSGFDEPQHIVPPTQTAERGSS